MMKKNLLVNAAANMMAKRKGKSEMKCPIADADTVEDTFVAIELVQPEDQTLDNGEEEEEFLTAIEKGDVNTFMEMLMKKEEIWLNLECKDANGKSALQVAIAQGYSVIVEQLMLQGVEIGDALLRAVDVALPETVKKICEFAEKLPSKEERRAIMDCRSINDDYHPDITPIVLAAQRNDFNIVKILLDFGLKITDASGSKEVSDPEVAVDSLLKSVGTLEVYKAVASEAYLSLGYADPVEKAFELSDTLSKLSRTDVEFKASYLELADNVDEIARGIIANARNTEEIMTVLTHYEKKKGDTHDLQAERNMGPLPKLSKAIAFDQKQFVAHPNCQQAVLAKFYGRLAYIRDRTATFRRLLFLAIVFCFPFVSLAYLYVPTTWVRNNVGCPYTKFMLQMSSDLIFVFLLSADTFFNEGVKTTFTLHRPTKVLLLLWIIGITWREIKAFRRRGFVIFAQTKHLRDSTLAFCFIVAVVFDITHYRYELSVANSTDTGEIIKENLDRARRSLNLDNVVPVVNLMGQFPNHTKDNDYHTIEITRNTSNGAIIVHRVPVIPVARARGGKTTNVKAGQLSPGEDYVADVTDPVFLAFMRHVWYHPRLIATVFFAVSTVISFLRMLPYVVVSDVIGPLQISLGTMITETSHFFLVVGVVVLSFSVGLTYIYSYYEEVKLQTCIALSGDEANTCQTGTLAHLFAGVVYLYWSVFGLETMDPLTLESQAWVLQAAGKSLYALFYVLVVVVLLNALIAVMSNVYNGVEENGDMEWKFASTVLWMDVLSDDDVVAPPFNLLPSKDVIENAFQRFYDQCSRLRRKQTVEHNGCKYKAPTKMNKRNGKKAKKPKPERSNYHRVMSRLVERYVASKTAGEVSVEADVTPSDIRALRNDLLSLKFEMFQKLLETKGDINLTTEYGLTIHDTTKDADNLFSHTEDIGEKVKGHLDYLFAYKTTLVENIAAIPPERTPTPPPPPPEMTDCWSQTDPPPPPRPRTPPPPPPVTLEFSSQTTPPPTPPPSPVLEDTFTQCTPPTPPPMVDRQTEIDPGLIPLEVSSIAKRFERKRAASMVPPKTLAHRPPIVEHKDPWRPFGTKIKNVSRPTSPTESYHRKNSSRSYNNLLSPDLPQSAGHGRTSSNRTSPAISPEMLRKIAGTRSTPNSRSNSMSSGSISPSDSIKSDVNPRTKRRSPVTPETSNTRKTTSTKRDTVGVGAAPKKTSRTPNPVKKQRPAAPSKKPRPPKPSGVP